MKSKLLIGIFAAALIALCAACAEVPPDEAGDPTLVGNWTNSPPPPESPLQDDEIKTFTVNADFTFECTLTITQMGNVTITGELSRDEGNIYTMGNMGSTNQQVAGMASAYNNKGLLIKFQGSNTCVFSSSDNDQSVDSFFGGTYYRVIDSN